MLKGDVKLELTYSVVVHAASVVCVQLMRCYEDPVTDGDDDDRVVHCRSKRRAFKSRLASLSYFNLFLYHDNFHFIVIAMEWCSVFLCGW